MPVPGDVGYERGDPSSAELLAVEDPAEPDRFEGFGDLSFSPPSGANPEGLAPEGEAPVPVEELVEARTAVSEVWANADGSQTVLSFSEPKYFQAEEGGPWLPVDTSLSPVDGDGDAWVSGPNSFSVTFAPIGAEVPAVQITTPAGEVLAFAPQVEVDSELTPVVDADAGVATYEQVWPGVDLRYTVTGAGVKEEMILHSRNAAAEWGFDVDGPELVQAEGGGLAPTGSPAAEALAREVPAPEGSWHITGLEVLDGRGRPVSEVAGGELVYDADGGAGDAAALVASVDGSWLAGLPSSAFPVVVDPSYVLIVSSHHVGHTNTGTACGSLYATPCGLRVGNSRAGGVDSFWRGGTFFDYGQYRTHPGGRPNNVSDAHITLANPTGATGSFPVAVHEATGWSSFGALAGGGQLSSGTVDTADVTLSVTARVRQWFAAGTWDRWFGFTGAETPGSYTYKTFSWWGMGLTTDGRATAPTLSGSERPTTLTPTLTASGSVDPENQALRYLIRILASPDPAGSVVTESGLLAQGTTSWTVPAGVLRNGTTYWWTAQAWDGHGWSDAAAPRQLAVDQRLGAGSVSPSDGAGPVSVNLATGNVSLGVSTPETTVVAGSLGLGLTYNSQAASQYGLDGRYFNDTNGNGLFDDNQVLARQDPQISMSWGTGSPGPSVNADNSLVEWTGWIQTPMSGSWRLGFLADDAVRVWVGNTATTATPVLDSWSYTSAMRTSAPIQFTAGVPQRIRIRYREQTGGASIAMHSDFSNMNSWSVVPSTWLSPAPQVIPQGWSIDSGAYGATYVRARHNATSITLLGADGETTEFARTGTGSAAGYRPPAGINDVVSVAPDGRILVAGEDGYDYEFDTRGDLLRVTTALDTKKPAALQFEWVDGKLVRAKDPVSGREVVLNYAGFLPSGDCPGFPPTGVYPDLGSLCSITTPAGSSFLHYADGGGIGRLAMFVNPGGETWSFGYDSAGRINRIRDPLATDAVTTSPPVRADDDTTRWLLAYDTAGRASQITAPEPLPGAPRPQRSYTYAAAHTDVDLAGTAANPDQRAGFDTAGRGTTERDALGRTTTTVWDATIDRVRWTQGPDGLRTGTVYDAAGNVTDVWGPAPAAWFGATTPTNGQHAPTQNQAATPRTQTAYDQGIPSLAATWWNNPDLAGRPTGNWTGFAERPNGELDRNWGTGVPAHSGVTNPDAFSGRLEGDLVLPSAGTWQLQAWRNAKIRIYLDDVLVSDAWVEAETWAPTVTISNATAGQRHRLRIELAETGGPSNHFSLHLYWKLGNGNLEIIPGTALSPRYGLATTTIEHRGAGQVPEVTATAYTNASIGAHLGLATSTTQDPGGLALTSSTGYEAPGANSYLRRTSRTLPAGNTWTDSYWGDTQAVANPCLPGNPLVNQGGLVRFNTGPDPTGPDGAIVRETIHDARGRAAGTRVGSEPWTCTSYDTRGRTTTIEHPAFGGSPARSVSFDHAVDGNPLVTSVTDPAGTVTTTVDLLGRVVSYQDVWGQSSTTTYTYDQAGRRTSSAGPAGAMAWTYDDAGAVLTTVLDGQPLATATYDPVTGRLARVAYGNSTTLGTATVPIAYDTLGRLTTMEWRDPAGAVFSSDHVTRDLTGNIVDQSIDGVDVNPAGANYTYHPTGRLVNAALPGWAGTWSFAASGGCGPLTTAGRNTNRTAATVNGAQVTYCYDEADRLVSTTEAGIGTLAYDAHGNTTEIAGEVHGYDAADRHLTTTAGSTTVAYTRDALDRIVARKLNGATIARYGHSLDGDTPAYTLDPILDVVTERTLALPGGVLLTRRPGTDTWAHPNIHGDLVATTDTAGTPAGANTVYDPYGNLIAGAVPDTSAGSFDYGWLGQHQRPLEHEPGLHPIIEMGARQYSPLLGRFLEVDPVEGGSANDYDYTDADPVNQSDLTGECLFGRRKGGGCKGGVRVVANSVNAVKRGTKAHHAARWARGRWNRDTTSAGGCWVLACLTGYTYRNARGARRWKLGIQVGVTTPGPFASTSSGRPGRYPTSSFSMGSTVCVGRSARASGWNFTVGPGKCLGVYSGP